MVSYLDKSRVNVARYRCLMRRLAKVLIRVLLHLQVVVISMTCKTGMCFFGHNYAEKPTRPHGQSFDVRAALSYLWSVSCARSTAVYIKGRS